jgi:hypothetical protein
VGEDLQDRAGEVWNRTCDALATGLPCEAGPGDAMLLRAIDFDGRVNNGGLLNRVEEDEGLSPWARRRLSRGWTQLAARFKRQGRRV